MLGTRWTAGHDDARAAAAGRLLTAGAEFIDNVHQDQQLRYVDPASPVFVIDRSSRPAGGLCSGRDQADALADRRTAGCATIGYDDFQRVTPRAALIVMPSSNQSFKYLYGNAFRAPNEYELNAFYFGDGTRDLRPESIDTHELVWERYTNDWLRTSVSAYWYKADGLITLVPDPSTLLGTTYVNGGHVRAKGLELEAQMRLSGGIAGSDELCVAARRGRPDGRDARELARTDDETAAERALAVQAIVRVDGGAVAQQPADARRRHLKPAATANVTIDFRRRRRFELVGVAANLFNVRVCRPGLGRAPTGRDRTERQDAARRRELEALGQVVDAESNNGRTHSDRPEPGDDLKRFRSVRGVPF